VGPYRRHEITVRNNENGKGHGKTTTGKTDNRKSGNRKIWQRKMTGHEKGQRRTDGNSCLGNRKKWQPEKWAFISFTSCVTRMTQLQACVTWVCLNTKDYQRLALWPMHFFEPYAA